MEMRPADVGIWAHTGGYVLAFDQVGDGGDRETHTHVATSIREVVTLLIERLEWLDESKASQAVEGALKGRSR